MSSLKMSKIEYNLKLFIYYLNKWGLYHGTRLFISILFRKTNCIYVPGIKYSFRLRQGTTDIKMFNRIFLNKEYDFNLPFKPKVIVDVGANIGLFSIILKNRFPDAKIICIEPDIENFCELVNNLREYSNIEFLHKALWNANQKLYLSDEKKLGKWGMIINSDIDEKNVDAVTMNEIFKLFNLNTIDLLKIDIEGSERNVFESGFEEWLSKVKIISIELHDWIKNDCSKMFFLAINKCFKSYRFQNHGETNIIFNKDILH